MTIAMKKCTPVLIVDAVEPSLPFFEKLGMARGPSVPETVDGKERLAFVILDNGSFEVMLQTAASVKADMPNLAGILDHKTHLFIELADRAALEEVKRALADHALEMPQRKTPYGSTEVGYREPGGHHVTFAAFGE